jgi:hypothetical protein
VLPIFVPLLQLLGVPLLIRIQREQVRAEPGAAAAG